MPFKKYFPVTSKQIFLNHAGMSAMSEPARNEVVRVTELISQYGSVAGPELGSLLESAREDIALLIGSHARNISFIQNTTDGISMIAAGLDIGKGDNVVVPMCEYPSNLYSWLLLGRQGVEVRIVGDIDRLPETNELMSNVDSRTKVLAISYVQFHSGEVAPIIKLSEALRNKALLVVDGVQAVGALDVEFDRSSIDCLISGAHKWLVGPPGTGFICMSDKAKELVRPTRVGWATIKDTDDLPDMSLSTHSDGRKYEGGTYNYSGIAGMAASSRLLTDIGADKIRDMVLKNTATVRQLLVDELGAGRIQFHSGGVEGKSGIVSFKIDGVDSVKMASELAKKAIIVKERRGYIRISPHFYNSSDEFGLLAKEIRAIS